MPRLTWIVTLLAACSDSSSTADVGRPELSIADRGLTEAHRDLGAADLRPDQPRPPAQWKTVPGASLALHGHTLTPLLDGSALIVGGFTYDAAGLVKTFHTKTYHYLPASDTIVEAGELKTARGEHSATRLADGRVLVIGGKNDQSWLTSSEIFDPAKPANLAWSTGPDLLEERLGHRALLLPSGEVLVTGGGVGTSTLQSIAIYQPATQSFKLSLATLKRPRRYHAAVVLANGKVLIAGGERGGPASSVIYHDDLEVLDVQTGASGAALTMTRARSFASATLLDDGRVLIAGGFCGGCQSGPELDELYDPKTDGLAAIPHPGGVLASHFATKLLDGRVVIGGSSYASGAPVVAFSPGGTAPGWDTLPSLAQPHVSGAAATLLDGTVLVVGGLATTAPTHADKVERLFP